MNVKEFIEFLKTMPQDAVVQVLEHHSAHDYYLQGGELTLSEAGVKRCKSSYLHSYKYRSRRLPIKRCRASPASSRRAMLHIPLY